MKKLAMSLLVLGSSFAAVAAEEFAKYDLDDNGVISTEEAKANVSLVHQFKDLDADNNGELSKQEFAKFVAE